MRIIVALIISLLLIGLTACSSTPKKDNFAEETDATTDPAATANTETPAPISIQRVVLIRDVWDVVYKGESYRDDGPTGVILMPSGSSKIMAVCEALQSLRPAATQGTDLRPSFWLSKQNRDEIGDNPYACDTLAANYDFERADAILQAMNALRPSNTDKLSGEGPYLLGFSGNQDTNVVLIDGSLKTGAEQIGELMRAWRNKILQEPSLWHLAESAEGSQATTLEADGESDDKSLWGKVKNLIGTDFLSSSGSVLIWMVKTATGIPLP